MTSIKIQAYIDHIQKFIAVSRTNIASGCFVDISDIETQINVLVDMISRIQTVNLNTIVPKLTNLMRELEHIENDLHTQHKYLNTKTQVSKIYAAAAYHSK
jgi:hypothetical protein